MLAVLVSCKRKLSLIFLIANSPYFCSNECMKSHKPVSLEKMNKEGNFLKKLWCCVGGRVYQGNKVLSTELILLVV